MLCPPTFSGGIVLALCLFIHIDSSVAGRQDSPAQEEYPEEYLVLLGDATAGSRGSSHLRHGQALRFPNPLCVSFSNSLWSLLPLLKRGGRGEPLPPRLRYFGATLKTMTPCAPRAHSCCASVYGSAVAFNRIENPPGLSERLVGTPASPACWCLVRRVCQACRVKQLKGVRSCNRTVIRL